MTYLPGLSLLLCSWDSAEKVLHLVNRSTFGTWSCKEMPQMRRKQFIWKTAKGLMCFCTTGNTGHVSPEYNKTDMTMHRKNCILADNIKALDDQMSASLSCWKAPSAATTLCVTAASIVHSEVTLLPKYELRHHLQLFPTHHDGWLWILSCSIPANYKHFGLFCASCETPA